MLGGIIMAKVKQLTKKELTRLKKVLENLENEVYNLYRNISGTFAKAEMYDYDDEIIDVEFKYGIQDGCDNVTHTESISIDRKTMTIIN